MVLQEFANARLLPILTFLVLRRTQHVTEGHRSVGAFFPSVT